MVKLPTKHLLTMRTRLLDLQDHTCPLCEKSFKGRDAKKPALDHDHKTGYVRDVLCLNCNRREGEVINRAGTCIKGDGKKWLANLLAYYSKHSVPQHGGYTHPTHLTENEKRIKRNKQAQRRRKAAKAK